MAVSFPRSCNITLEPRSLSNAFSFPHHLFIWSTCPIYHDPVSFQSYTYLCLTSISSQPSVARCINFPELRTTNWVAYNNRNHNSGLSECQQGHAFSETLYGRSSHASSSYWWLPAILPWHFPNESVSVCPYLSCKDSSGCIRVHLNPIWPQLNYISKDPIFQIRSHTEVKLDMILEEIPFNSV